MTAVYSPECEGSIRHYNRFLVNEFTGLFHSESAFYSEDVCFTQYANSTNYRHWLTQYPHAVRKFLQKIRCTVSARRITGANYNETPSDVLQDYIRHPLLLTDHLIRPSS